ncbi:hypothetical protein ACFX19_000085 [Malus domestica]
MLNFRELINDCGLSDLCFNGNSFTWFTRITTRHGGVKERLDRCMASLNWQSLFPLSPVNHLDQSKSNHLPILLCTKGESERSSRRRPTFRFEEFWTHHEECKARGPLFLKDLMNCLAKKRHFGAKDIGTSKSGEVIVTIDRRVTTDMNAHLKQNFTNEEIKEAIFQMHLSKSPSSDGMPPLFFQKYWEIVGSDVTHAIKSFLKSGKLLKQIHFTPVALIPKVHEPKYMSNMRLISLCNVLFKIASKALANKLKAFLPHIISHHQSAFVP